MSTGGYRSRLPGADRHAGLQRPATKFLRRAMLALGAYQVDATSERIRDGHARGRDAASAARPP